MVAIVENWAVVTGRVLGVEDAPALPEFAAVELEVEGVEPFEGYPDLLHVGPGSGLTVPTYLRAWFGDRPRSPRSPRPARS